MGIGDRNNPKPKGNPEAGPSAKSYESLEKVYFGTEGSTEFQQVLPQEVKDAMAQDRLIELPPAPDEFPPMPIPENADPIVAIAARELALRWYAEAQDEAWFSRDNLAAAMYWELSKAIAAAEYELNKAEGVLWSLAPDDAGRVWAYARVSTASNRVEGLRERLKTMI